MRGLLASAQNSDSLERGVLVEFGKLQLKQNRGWQGLKILIEVCHWNELKLKICGLLIFLAKYL